MVDLICIFLFYILLCCIPHLPLDLQIALKLGIFSVLQCRHLVPLVHVSSINGIYKLPQELPNNLRLRILENRKFQGNFSNAKDYSLVPMLSLKMSFFQQQYKITKKQILNSSHSAPVYTKFTVCLKYFFRDCRKNFFFVNSMPQASSNLNLLTIFIFLIPLTKF